MRRWGLLAGLAAFAVLSVVVSGAPASPTAVAKPTFQLVTPTTCETGTTRLGRACVDRPTITNWVIGDGSAQWNMPGQWLTTYVWTVPQKVAPTGAGLTMTLSAEERTGRPGNRICPAMGATSGFAFRGEPAQPVVLGFCAEQPAQPSLTRGKPATLLPPKTAAAGSRLKLVIGLQDGPVFTYTYKALPAPKKKKKKQGCSIRRGQSLAAVAAEYCINMQNKRYVPFESTVEAGDTVRLCNVDKFFHKPFSYSASNRFELGNMKPGTCRTVKVHANPKKTVTLFCELHSAMKGVVNVRPNR